MAKNRGYFFPAHPWQGIRQLHTKSKAYNKWTTSWHVRMLYSLLYNLSGNKFTPNWSDGVWAHEWKCRTFVSCCKLSDSVIKSGDSWPLINNERLDNLLNTTQCELVFHQQQPLTSTWHMQQASSVYLFDHLLVCQQDYTKLWADLAEIFREG